jgi:zinc/manganese transport system substrate-binding protein
MKAFSSSLLLFAAAWVAPAAHAKLAVVATTPDLAAIATEVGGKEVRVTTLARPTEDPHFVDARPSFIVKLRKADALLYNGAELEAGWLPPLIQSSRNRRIMPGAPGDLRGNEGIPMLEVPNTLDRSQGDIHPLGNPHYLVDPANAVILARHLAGAFGRLDAKNAAAYQANADRFIATLEARLKQWQARLAPYHGQAVVAYHNSWPYFARRFGLDIHLFLEPKPGIPPTPAHLARVIAQMKTLRARAILLCPYQNRRTADTVARATGATVVPVTQFPGGVNGAGPGYVEMMDYLVNHLASALAKKTAQ